MYIDDLKVEQYYISRDQADMQKGWTLDTVKRFDVETFRFEKKICFHLYKTYLEYQINSEKYNEVRARLNSMLCGLKKTKKGRIDFYL